MMRKIAASWIFPVSTPPIKNGIVTIDEDGTIVDVSGVSSSFVETEGVEFYGGAIIPGMVNAHCHIEYSHLLGKLEPYGGLADFVRQIAPANTNYLEETIVEKALHALRAMRQQGVVALGDIANSGLCFKIKSSEPIYSHTFIECVGLNPKKAGEIIEKAQMAQKFAEQCNLSHSVTLHSSYAVSETLKNKFYTVFDSDFLSLHNQEGKDEIALFSSRSGNFVRLFNDMNLPLPPIHYSHSLQDLLRGMPIDKHILLVHNTYTTAEDIFYLRAKGFCNIHFVMCINSNYFIEKKYPDIEMLLNSGYNVGLGTDSFASTHSYNILEEMKTILFNFPKLSFHTLLSCATLGGAKALKVDDLYGTIEKGKRPHLVLLSHFDFANMTVTPQTSSTLLV